MRDRSQHCAFRRRLGTNAEFQNPETRHTDTGAPHSPVVQQTAVPHQWEEERVRMRVLSRQVADSMTELSDATLDALMSTAGSLKAKLAEYREQREHEQRRVSTPSRPAVNHS